MKRIGDNIMEKEVILEKLLSLYPEEQREDIKQLLENMTPDKYDLIGEIINKYENNVSKIQDDRKKAGLLWALQNSNNKIGELQAKIRKLDSIIYDYEQIAKRSARDADLYKRIYNSSEGRKAAECDAYYKHYLRKAEEASYKRKKEIEKQAELRQELKRENDNNGVIRSEVTSVLARIATDDLKKAKANKEFTELIRVLSEGEDKEEIDKILKTYSQEEKLDSVAAVEDEKTPDTEREVVENEVNEKRERRRELVAEELELEGLVEEQEKQKSATKQPGD